MQRNQTYKFYFRNPDCDFLVPSASSVRDALAIALEHTGCDPFSLVQVDQPDPDDPFNPDAFSPLQGGALDFYLFPYD